MWKTALGEKQPALFDTRGVSFGLVWNMWAIPKPVSGNLSGTMETLLALSSASSLVLEHVTF